MQVGRNQRKEMGPHLFKKMYIAAQLTLSESGIKDKIPLQKTITLHPSGDNNQTTHSFWGPQPCWQNQVFGALKKRVKVWVLSMFLREGAITEKALLPGPTLGEETHSIPCLPSLVDQVGLIGKRGSLK